MEYDLLVIGAGSGGVRAARIAAGHGKKVALFESDLVGGTCVIRGCVPKKLMVYASSMVKQLKASEAFGWEHPGSQFNWQLLVQNKNKEIQRLNKIYHKLLDDSGVELIPYHGKIVGNHQVEANGRIYESDKILIATGARPFFPPLDGIEYAISSNEALSLKHFPDRITIIGAGYIAVEFACIFNSLGAEVNLIYRGEKILRGFDQDIQDHAHQSFAKNGIHIHTQSHIKSIEKNGMSLKVTLEDGKVLDDQNQVLCAAGRVANTKGLGLENIGVETKPNGQIIVDKNQNCGIPSVFAVGDVCNEHNLTPVAIKEGHLLVDRLFAGGDSYPEYDCIPTTVFSQPEIASCGLTEEQARQKHHQIKLYRSQFRAMKYSMSDVEDKTFMKLIVEEETDKVIGCHIAGADAGEIIQGFAVAIKQGLKKSRLDQCIGIHPTSAEELVTMK